MAELVVAPFLEPLEDRVEPLVRVCLQVAEDRDIAGVADLFRQVGGVVDELRPEAGAFLGLGQEAQIHRHARLAQGVVDEAGVPRLVARHVAEQFADVGIVAAALHFLVAHAAREFRGAGRHQEVDEFGPQAGVHACPIDMVPILVLLEMALVRVGFHPGQQLVPVLAHRRHVDAVHLVEVGGVEARVQQGRLRCHRGCVELVGQFGMQFAMVVVSPRSFIPGSPRIRRIRTVP